MASDFLNGGYYPIGGSQRIADAAAHMIEQQGGKCLVSHPVQEILIRDNQAVGVSTTHKKKRHEFYAPIVISNAGVATTFDQLVAPQWGASERLRLAAMERGTSALILYLGLNDNPRSAGFENCNYWLFQNLDHNLKPKPEEVEGAFLSFGSLRDPQLNQHTAQIVTFSQGDEWTEFENRRWMKRGPEYLALKQRWADRMLDFVELRLPGLRALVDYQELSTPLSVTSFLGHPAGQIYGHACTINRLETISFPRERRSKTCC